MHSVSYFLVAAFHFEMNCSGSANSLYSPPSNSEPGTITLSSEHLAVRISAPREASFRMTWSGRLGFGFGFGFGFGLGLGSR